MGPLAVGADPLVATRPLLPACGSAERTPRSAFVIKSRFFFFLIAVVFFFSFLIIFNFFVVVFCKTQPRGC